MCMMGCLRNSPSLYMLDWFVFVRSVIAVSGESGRLSLTLKLHMHDINTSMNREM